MKTPPNVEFKFDWKPITELPEKCVQVFLWYPCPHNTFVTGFYWAGTQRFEEDKMTHGKFLNSFTHWSYTPNLDALMNCDDE